MTVRIEKLRSTYDIDIKFRHFPLHPNTPEDGMTLEELFAGRDFDVAAAQRRMAALMKEEGLAYGDRNMTFNSRLAQELAVWAESQSGGGRIHEALFRAYFVDGINIAKIDHLIEIARNIGLPADEAAAVLTTRRCKTIVDADWIRSRQLGITGVPTFVMGNRGISGAQPYEALQKFVLNAGARQRDEFVSEGLPGKTSGRSDR